MLWKVDSAEGAGAEPCLMVIRHCWEAGISTATHLDFLPLLCGRFYHFHLSVGISTTESTASPWAFLPLLRGHFYHFSVDISTASLLGIYTTFLWAFLPLLYCHFCHFSVGISTSSLWAFLPPLCWELLPVCVSGIFSTDPVPLTRCEKLRFYFIH